MISIIHLYIFTLQFSLLIRSFGILQETNIEQVHLTGALLVFGVGTLYAFIQTGLSYQMYPEFNGVRVCRVRLFISCLALAGLIVSIL